jgi:hypothetical protein
MAAVAYKEYRIEIRPVTIPGGWSAQVHLWTFQASTARVVPLSLPTHLAFSSAEGAHSYAEKWAQRWVDQTLGESTESTPATSSSGPKRQSA